MANLIEVSNQVINVTSAEMNAILARRWTQIIFPLLQLETASAEQKRFLAYRYLDGIIRDVTNKVTALREEVEPELDRLERSERGLGIPPTTSEDSDTESLARCLRCGKLVN